MKIETATHNHDEAARRSFVKHINSQADQAERFAKLADTLDDPADKQLWAARARVLMAEQQQRLQQFERATK